MKLHIKINEYLGENDVHCIDLIEIFKLDKQNENKT